MKQVIKNKLLAEGQRLDGLTVYPTEELLGSMKEVKEFATFYLNHRESLEVARATLLIDYCDSQTFTKEQVDAFKLGLNSFLKIFESSEEDTKTYLKDAEQKRQSVG